MDVGTEPGTVSPVGVATGVNPMNAGVSTACVAAGESPPRGVEACSVANKSGVDEEAGLISPHPSMKNNATVIQSGLVLVIVPFK